MTDTDWISLAVLAALAFALWVIQKSSSATLRSASGVSSYAHMGQPCRKHQPLLQRLKRPFHRPHLPHPHLPLRQHLRQWLSRSNRKC